MALDILIAVPTYESIMPETFKSIYELEIPDDVNVYFDSIRGYTVEMARNRAVELANEYNVDYVFMVDNDIVLQESALKLLLEHDEDVVLGCYMHRDPGTPNSINTNLCKLGQFNYHAQVTAKEIKGFAKHGVQLLQVKGGGLGCALIKMSLFDKLSKPFFAWRSYEDGRSLSEDLHFAENCAFHDVNIYADPRVQCGHMFRFEKKVE